MKRVLVSACLLGLKVRFDGLSKENKDILDLIDEFEFIPVCPEIMGGLSTPRVPAEIRDGKVINKLGADVTENYIKGAEEALRLCRIYDCDMVVLKSKSPSCGKSLVYDGTFSGNLVEGNGITTNYLIKNGIKVYSEDEFIKEYKMGDNNMEEEPKIEIVIDPNKIIDTSDDVYLPPVEEPTIDLEEVIKETSEIVGDNNG